MIIPTPGITQPAFAPYSANLPVKFPRNSIAKLYAVVCKKKHARARVRETGKRERERERESKGTRGPRATAITIINFSVFGSLADYSRVN